MRMTPTQYNAQINRRHIRLINAVLSLVRFGGATCPPLLRRHGYDVKALDKVIPTRLGEIKPDVVVENTQVTAPVILVEAKGGAHLNVPQARRYDQATPAELERVCDTGLKDVAYAAYDHHAPGLAQGVVDQGFAFPVLSFGETMLRLHGNFQDARINQELRQGVGFKLDEVYPAVKFDHQSSFFDVGSEVSRKLAAMFLGGPATITIEQLAESSTPLIWHLLDDGGKEELTNRIKQVIRAIQETSFAAYITLTLRAGVVSVRRPASLSRIQIDALDGHRKALLEKLEAL